jgi:hypothetical protein
MTRITLTHKRPKQVQMTMELSTELESACTQIRVECHI